MLEDFSNAIRLKPDWYLKLLDVERGLDKKWVEEARQSEKELGRVHSSKLWIEMEYVYILEHPCPCY